jgi:hypothetical protein
MARTQKLTREQALEKFEAEVTSLNAGEIEVCVIGRSPLIFNAMSLKAMQALLLPERKTRSQQAATLKHDPLQEFRDSVYRSRDEVNSLTRLEFPAPACKGVLRECAVDLPSEVTKAKIGRLTWVEGYRVPVWGVPQLIMSGVRNSDINHTPDVRTRAILPEWAIRVSIRYIKPMITERVLSALLQFGGMTIGLGDWRQQKGSGSFGQFELCDEKDPRFERIVATGGREAQDRALEDPEFFDFESERLFDWFYDEIKRRDREALLSSSRKSRNRRTKETGLGADGAQAG